MAGLCNYSFKRLLFILANNYIKLLPLGFFLMRNATKNKCYDDFSLRLTMWNDKCRKRLDVELNMDWHFTQSTTIHVMTYLPELQAHSSVVQEWVCWFRAVDTVLSASPTDPAMKSQTWWHRRSLSGLKTRVCYCCRRPIGEIIPTLL